MKNYKVEGERVPRSFRPNVDTSTKPTWNEAPLSADEIEEWLSHKKIPDKFNGHEVAGGLRLLFQIWEPEDEICHDLYGRYTIPFPGKDTMKEVLNALQLPQCYPHDLVRRSHIPARVQPVFGSQENRIGIVCQSPDFKSSFMTLALSYDPISKITTGFLGGMVNRAGSGPITSLLRRLREVSACAIQPMLLPVLAYSVWCDELRMCVSDDTYDIRIVQERTGLMDRYLGSKTRTETRADPNEFDSIHKALVQTHASLTNELSKFIEDLGTGCEHGLKAIEENERSLIFRKVVDISQQRKVSEEALTSYLQHWLLTAKVVLHQRDQQLSRVGMQLQVLYNLMQQRIAEETKRDSSAMKSIALLTMIFLPSTALATIFSMNPFFFLSPQTQQLQVSSQFWIFWAVALPLTALVIIIWILWTQRKEVLKLWRLVKRRGRDKGEDEETGKKK